MIKEQALVLLKHDVIQRSLIGKIITRFEDSGLKIIGAKMIWPDESLALKYYPFNEEWALEVFKKTKKVYDEKGKKFEYKDRKEHGLTIQKWLVNFLKEGPVITLVLEGPHAIEIIRKMIGSTEPRQATPGTIRGDFAVAESYALADSKKRALRNLIHASDSVENAQREIAVWFDNKELHNYAKELDKHL